MLAPQPSGARGHAAWHQPQLDVYGELLAAVHRLHDQLGEFDDLERRFLVGLADAAAGAWQQTDHGIWEIRGAPRHYVHSKLMCWVAMDRAIELAPDLGAEHRLDTWGRTRAAIHNAILEQGWNDDIGAFTQTFGGRELDASTLLMPSLWFLPADDPRMLATIDLIDQRLTDDHGLVYRYEGDDGLDGEEGTFLLSSFWLAEALALAGRTGRARELFERAIGFRNDVDLLAEEIDSATGELLGNFPQAFSHIGLINAAWAIGRSGGERRPAGLPGASLIWIRR